MDEDASAFPQARSHPRQRFSVKRSVSFLTFAATAVGAAASAGAAPAPATLNVTYDVPKLSVAEYHAPYVAIWIENPANGNAAGTLSVRFKPNHEKWLKDMRQWWRKAGRTLTLTNAMSGPTRAPGRQVVAFTSADGVLKNLKPGQYTLVVEAAREAGGHETVRVPFTWGKTGKPATARGTAELGAVTVSVSGGK